MSIYKKPDDIPWAKGWGVTCNEAERRLMGRCVVNPRHKMEDVHHVYYLRWFWLPWPNKKVPGIRPIAGLERVGKDVFPVCASCHGRLHHPSLWDQEPGRKERNGNYLGTIFRLRLRWLFWETFSHIFPSTFVSGLRLNAFSMILILFFTSLLVVGAYYSYENIVYIQQAVASWKATIEATASHVCKI